MVLPLRGRVARLRAYCLTLMTPDAEEPEPFTARTRTLCVTPFLNPVNVYLVVVELTVLETQVLPPLELNWTRTEVRGAPLDAFVQATDSVDDACFVT